MDKPTLKPCPFCGFDDPGWTHGVGYAHVICGDCGASGPTYETDGEFGDNAERLWDTRPIEDALRARIAELETDRDNAYHLLSCARAEMDELRRELDAVKSSAELRLGAINGIQQQCNESRRLHEGIIDNHQARIAALEKECRGYRALIDTHEELKAEHQQRIAELEAALRWYADVTNWTFETNMEDSAAEADAGNRARRVLGES